MRDNVMDWVFGVRSFCRVGVMTVLAWAALGRAAEPVKSAAELERVRALVEAGALPRRAVPEAELSLEKSRLVETLQKTLPKRGLTEAELPAMLEAATRLRDLAREQLTLTRSRVEAGALPIKRLEIDKEAADAADKQYDLAQTRARLVRELAAMARAESRLEELEDQELAFVSEGDGDPFWDDDIAAVNEAFYEAFGVPLPVSADGYTALHESLGFDHTGRLDVPVNPDDPEGLFLIELLETWDIPFIAFRSAVPGQSTGPHIHIGPRSERIPVGGLH
jgi:PAS domain-containing protein